MSTKSHHSDDESSVDHSDILPRITFTNSFDDAPGREEESIFSNESDERRLIQPTVSYSEGSKPTSINITQSLDMVVDYVEVTALTGMPCHDILSKNIEFPRITKTFGSGLLSAAPTESGLISDMKTHEHMFLLGKERGCPQRRVTSVAQSSTKHSQLPETQNINPPSFPSRMATPESTRGLCNSFVSERHSFRRSTLSTSVKTVLRDKSRLQSSIGTSQPMATKPRHGVSSEATSTSSPSAPSARWTFGSDHPSKTLITLTSTSSPSVKGSVLSVHHPKTLSSESSNKASSLKSRLAGRCKDDVQATWTLRCPSTRHSLLTMFLVVLTTVVAMAAGSDPPSCEWAAGSKARRFVRVREDAPLGYAILSVNVTQPELLQLTQSQDGSPLFRVPAAPVQEGRVVVAGPLPQLLQQQQAAPVIKFMLTCGDNPFTQQVTVYVEDVNDHAPVFASPTIDIAVDELTPPGLVVLAGIKATDDDKPNTANSEVQLQIVTGDPQGYFELVDRKKGVVQLTKTLDYDVGPRHFELQILAKDMGTPSLSATALLRVTVLDADDRPPLFSAPLHTVEMPEDPGLNQGGTLYRLLFPEPPISARDGDEGINATLRYSIVPGPHSTAFSIDPLTGNVAQVQHIDRERLESNPIMLRLRAHQVNDPHREGSSLLSVTVSDLNDNVPHFEHDLYAISIVENLPTGFSVVQVAAHDVDDGANKQFRYEVLGDDSALSVNAETGWLTVANHSLLDREARPTITLQVCARPLLPLVDHPFAFAGGSRSPAMDSISSSSSTRKRQTDPVDAPAVVTKTVAGVFSSVPSVAPPAVELDSTTSTTELSSSTSRSVTRNTLPFKPSVPDRTHSSTSSVVKSTLRTQRQGFNPGTTSAPSVRGFPTISPVPKIDEVFTAQDAMPVLETLPFGTRTAPRKVARSLEGDANLENLKAVTFTHVTSNIEPPDVVPNPVTAEPDSEVTLGSLRIRTKRDSEAFRKFNTRRRGNPKSLIPIKIVGEDGDTVPSDDLSGELSHNLSCAAIQLTLLDANDNNPVFLPSNQYHFTVRQDAVPGMTIGKVESVDADSGINGQVTYLLQERNSVLNGSGSAPSSDHNQAVTIDRESGYLHLNAKLQVGEFTLFVEASDSPASVSEKRTSLAVVVISVTAGDTWQPRFEGAPFEFWVGGEAEIGTSVGQVRVADLDPRHVFFDMFHNYKEGVPFAIEETSGIVSVVALLDDFSRTDYHFETVVTDGRASLVTNLTVHVAASARTTERTDIVLEMSVQENLAGGLVGDIRTDLLEHGIKLAEEPHLELVSPESRELFVIAQDGALYTGAPLDHETRPSHTLVVLSAKTALIFYVRVQVEDVNDNPPQLNAVSYEGTVSEDATAGALITVTPKIQVSDADQYPDATWSLRLIGANADMFRIHEKSGTIELVSGTLDREIVPSYRLMIQATDDGNLFTSANLTIKLEDVNDNYPEFSTSNALAASSSQEVVVIDGKSRMQQPLPSEEFLEDSEAAVIRIPETLPIGSRITQLMAHDKDVGLFADIRYMIESQTLYDFADNISSVPLIQPANAFSVESKSGSLIVAGEIAANHFYLLNVSAIDGGGLSTTTIVSVAVYDVNDHAPKFLHPIYNFDILEGTYLVGEVGAVTAVDVDLEENGRVSYQIVLNDSFVAKNFPFRVGENSGMILATGQVDRERQSRYQFTVIASDHGEPQQSSSVTVHITVSDSNDHDPKFFGYQTIYSASEETHTNFSMPVYLKTIPENSPVGTHILNVFANDSDSVNSGNGIVLYKIEEKNSPFGIDSKTGSVYTVGSLDYESSPILRATIVASDMGTPARSASALLQVSLTDVREEPTDRLFDEEQYVVHVAENSEVPVALLNLTSSWMRLSEQGMHFMLADSDAPDIVTVDTESGQIYLIKSLDREERAEYKFKLRALAPLEVFRSSTVAKRRNDHYDLSPGPSAAALSSSETVVESIGVAVPVLTSLSSSRSQRIPAVKTLTPTKLVPQRMQLEQETTQRTLEQQQKADIVPSVRSPSPQRWQDRWRSGRSDRTTRSSGGRDRWRNKKMRRDVEGYNKLEERIPHLAEEEGGQFVGSTTPDLLIQEAKSRRTSRSSVTEGSDRNGRAGRRGYLIPTGDRDFGMKLTSEQDDLATAENVNNATLWKNHKGSSDERLTPVPISTTTEDTPSFSSPASASLQLNEVWIVLKVVDENDNPPRFGHEGRPLVAAVPSTALYGHEILTIDVTDPDEGAHGAVRFTMLQSGPADHARHKFAVDSLTGKVTVVGSLRGDEGRMFGFDVRATDDEGRPGGLSSVTNVFIHVLGGRGQVVVELEAPPQLVAPHLQEIQLLLSNASGLDVRVQRIAPHATGSALLTSQDTVPLPSTDLYIYGVAPGSRSVVEGGRLREALQAQPSLLMPNGLKVMGLRTPNVLKEGSLLQTPEVAILVSAALVLLITVTALVCVCHKQRKRRRKPRPSPFTGGLSGTSGGGMSVLPLSFPVGPLPYTHMSDRSSASSDDLHNSKGQQQHFHRNHHDRLSKFRHLDENLHRHLGVGGEFHLRKNRSYMVGRKKSIHESRRERRRQPDLCARIHSHTAECCAAFSSSGANSDEDGLPSRRSPMPLPHSKSPHPARRSRGSNMHLLGRGSVSPNSDLNEFAGDLDLDKAAALRRSRKSRRSRRACCGDGCPNHGCCVDGRGLPAVDCSTTTTATTVASPHHMHHYRSNSPDSLERNPLSSYPHQHHHHGSHHHNHHHHNGTPHHHSSLHSLTLMNNNGGNNSSGSVGNINNLHGSTPALPTYPYPGPAPPPVPPNKPSKPPTFTTSESQPIISIPRSQLRRPMQVPNDVTEL